MCEATREFKCEVEATPYNGYSGIVDAQPPNQVLSCKNRYVESNPKPVLILDPFITMKQVSILGALASTYLTGNRIPLTRY
jgi:hypothetical protein